MTFVWLIKKNTHTQGLKEQILKGKGMKCVRKGTVQPFISVPEIHWFIFWYENGI